MKLLSLLPSSLLLLALAVVLPPLPRVRAFLTASPRSPPHHRRRRSSVLSDATATPAETDGYFRAVECANGARSSLEELDRLASVLEDVDGCKFEADGDEESCDREIQDRMDVAHILRLRIELQIRKDHLNKENLFASDVKKSHDDDERRRFKEMIQANRDKVVSDGSDLGLW